MSSYEYGKPYYEISRPIASFCDSVWCGFNNITIAYQSPSTWLCLPTRLVHVGTDLRYLVLQLTLLYKCFQMSNKHRCGFAFLWNIRLWHNNCQSHNYYCYLKKSQISYQSIDLQTITRIC